MMMVLLLIGVSVLAAVEGGGGGFALFGVISFPKSCRLRGDDAQSSISDA